MSPTPPAGLRWVDSPFGRGMALMLALVSIIVSLYVGWRYVGLVNCLNDRDLTDQRRTSAIAAATDAERIADLRLIQGAGDGAELRRKALAAREYTDQVRAAHPAPDVVPCS